MTGKSVAGPRSLRWGLIGPGRIAEKFAADLAYVPGAVRHSVFSRAAERGAAFAATHGFAHSHDDLGAFLADEALDVVYVATPHPAHFEQAAQSIAAGKPVLIEKPVTMTADQARQLATLSETHGVFAMEALWTRFLPATQRAKAIIDSGALGPVKRAEATLHYWRPYDAGDRLFNAELGGGVMHDLGVYPLSVLRYLIGPMKLEEARWSAAPSGVDQSASLKLSASGAPVTVSAAFEEQKTGEGENTLIIVGERKTLRMDRHFLHGPSLTVWDYPIDPPPSERLLINRLFKKLRLGSGKRERFARHSEGLNFQASAVQFALANGLTSHPVMPIAQSAEVLGLIEDALLEDNRQD